MALCQARSLPIVSLSGLSFSDELQQQPQHRGAFRVLPRTNLSG